MFDGLHVVFVSLLLPIFFFFCQLVILLKFLYDVNKKLRTMEKAALFTRRSCLHETKIDCYCLESARREYAI